MISRIIQQSNSALMQRNLLASSTLQKVFYPIALHNQPTQSASPLGQNRKIRLSPCYQQALLQNPSPAALQKPQGYKTHGSPKTGMDKPKSLFLKAAVIATLLALSFLAGKKSAKSPQTPEQSPPLSSHRAEIPKGTLKKDSEKITYIVLGATSNIGKEAVIHALKQGHTVVGTSRRPYQKGFLPEMEETGQFTLALTPGDQVANAQFWKELFDTHLPSHQEKAVIISTIGGAHAEQGTDLHYLNVTIPDAIISGLEQSEKGQNPSLVFHHCSSIAGPLSIGEYGRTKQVSTERMLSSPLNTRIFNIGYVIENTYDPDQEKSYHAYTVEQVAAQLPFHPVFGPETPVQPVAMDDVVDALCTYTADLGRREIHVVGPEALKLKEMYQFYTERYGKEFRPVEIDLRAAALWAKHHPKGHYAPYAVDYCLKFQNGEEVTFSPEGLEELLGRPLKRLEDMYGEEWNPQGMPRLPIKEHAKEAVHKMVTDSEALKDSVKGALLQLNLWMRGANPNQKEIPPYFWAD